MPPGANWEAISAIGQAVGAVGVILSLVFVGIQIRADTRAKRAAAIQQAFMAQSEFQRSLGFDAGAADVYLRGLRDPSALSGVEYVRFSLLVDSLFRNFEATLHYAEKGQIESGIWLGIRASMQDLIAYPGMRAIWSLRGNQHGPELRSFVDECLAKATAPRLYEAAVEAASSSTGGSGPS